MKKNGLPKYLINSNINEIRILFQRGKCINSQSFDLLYLQNRPKLTVLFAASKQFNSHVHKNRAKRLLRELFRLNHSLLPSDKSIALIAKKSILKQKFIHLENEYKKVLGSAFK